MPLQVPPPPSITPQQMNLLRIVAAMAWSDGNLEEGEVDLLLDRLSGLFAADAPQQQALRQELRDYLMQNLPLEELVPHLQTPEEKELVVKLGYEVIQASARTPNEARINAEETAAYHKLIRLMGLAPETVQRLEAEAATEPSHGQDLVNRLTRKLETFFRI